MGVALEKETAVQLEELIHALDEATQDSSNSVEEIAKSVESALTSAATGGMKLPEVCRKPSAKKYARHLVHVGPSERYTVIAMVWGEGQGTPIHDHAQTWCVECVLEGKIAVTNYRHLGKEKGDLEKLVKEQEIIAGFGEAGHLIPPLEYHTIHNALEDSPSITLHVYGGAYNECSIFEPAGADLYQRKKKVMSIDESLCEIPKSCQ